MDDVFLSKALAKCVQRVEIERRGIGFERVLLDGKPGPKRVRMGEREEGDVDFRFARFRGVDTKTAASDHAAVFVRFEL